MSHDLRQLQAIANTCKSAVPTHPWGDSEVIVSQTLALVKNYFTKNACLPFFTLKQYLFKNFVLSSSTQHQNRLEQQRRKPCIEQVKAPKKLFFYIF